MTKNLTKEVFDAMKNGKHISIGEPMWFTIVEHQEDLIEYFSKIELELVVKSDMGYCYFKGKDSNDLINLKRARRIVGMLNIIVLELKQMTSDDELEDFLSGSSTIRVDSINLHNTGRFSKALKQLGIKDNEEVLKELKSLQAFGFHKIDEGRIRLLKASERIFRYTKLSIPKNDNSEEE